MDQCGRCETRCSFLCFQVEPEFSSDDIQPLETSENVDELCANDDGQNSADEEEKDDDQESDEGQNTNDDEDEGQDCTDDEDDQDNDEAEENEEPMRDNDTNCDNVTDNAPSSSQMTKKENGKSKKKGLPEFFKLSKVKALSRRHQSKAKRKRQVAEPPDSEGGEHESEEPEEILSVEENENTNSAQVNDEESDEHSVQINTSEEDPLPDEETYRPVRKKPKLEHRVTKLSSSSGTFTVLSSTVEPNVTTVTEGNFRWDSRVALYWTMAVC